MIYINNNEYREGGKNSWWMGSNFQFFSNIVYNHYLRGSATREFSSVTLRYSVAITSRISG